MMNSSIFVYPIVPIKLSTTKNPYINDLIIALEKIGHKVINKNDERHIGVFSIFQYFFKTDIFHFNWIEYLSKKKLGGFQLVVFLFQIVLIKLFNKKIIWTLHNLSSHYSKDSFYRFIQRIMIKVSDVVIIHTKESYTYLEKKGVHKSKIVYFFHPFKHISETSSDFFQNKEKEYDILIWGLMSPYKGIYEFMSFLKNSEFDYKILLAGKFSDDLYFKKVASLAGNNTVIKNRFIEENELLDFHIQSKYIVFPYNSLSVLNSGSLALSLSYCSKIIGPNTGAFKELGHLGIICNFENYGDIVKLINRDFPALENENVVSNFILNNSWDNFAIEIDNALNKL